MGGSRGVCAAFFLAIALIMVGWGGSSARATSSLRLATETSSWKRCTSVHRGFSIAYPGRWHVASYHRLHVLGTGDAYRRLFFKKVVCLNYDPRPFTVFDGSEYPTTAVQVFRYSTARDYRQAIRWKFDPHGVRTIERQSVVVHGRRAIRYHVYTKAGQALWDRSHVYGYLIDFGHKGGIDIQAWRYGFKPIPWKQYRSNMAIVDRMAPTARIVTTS